MKNRLCLLFLSLLSLLAASVTYGYITVVSSSFPSTITGGTTYPFRFTTEHADTHWFYMRLQYLGHDNAWYSIANHPESSNNNGWDYALRDERRAWTFYGSLPGNRTWFCRVVAGTVDAFNTSVFRGETTIATFNVTATGSPDIKIDNFRPFSSSTAWTPNTARGQLSNIGNGVELAVYNTYFANGDYWYNTAANSFALYPGQSANFWIDIVDPKNAPMPGTHTMTASAFSSGDKKLSNNTRSFTQTFANHSNIQVTDLYINTAVAYVRPTFHYDFKNVGSTIGNDWVWVGAWNWQDENIGLGGQWFFVDFLNPGQMRTLTTHLAEVTLLPGWNNVSIFSYLRNEWLTPGDWFWVDYGNDGAQVILRDTGTNKGLRETDSTLTMVKKSNAPRNASISVNYGGYIHEGYPKYSGLGGVSAYDGSLPSFFSGNQSSTINTEVTLGYQLSNYIQLVDEDRHSITFSAGSLSGFKAQVDQFLVSLNAPYSMGINGSLTFETFYVDKHNDGTHYARSYRATGNPGLNFKLPGMSFTTLPIPVAGPTSVRFGITFGELTGSLSGVAQYDPSNAHPLSGGLQMNGNATVSVTAAYGVQTCNSGVYITGGGSANTTLSSKLAARIDGIYMSGEVSFGEVTVDISFTVELNGLCEIRVLTEFPVSNGASFNLFPSGEQRIYPF